MTWNPNTVALLALLCFLLIVLTFTVLIDPYIRKEHRKIMLITIALIVSLLMQNVVGYLLDLNGTMPYARTLVGIYGYSIRPLIILMYFYIVSDSRKIGPFWLLIGLNVLIHLTALFSGICFSIDANNVFHRGPLGYSCHVISGILLLQLLLLTIREYRNVRKAEMWIPLLNVILIIASVVFDSFVDYREYPFSFLIIAIVSSNLFYYIWLHLQFVREHEDDLKAQQRIQIMLSQIQPHFLYNTLSAIQYLCEYDPNAAGETTAKFSRYLQGNMSALRDDGEIPFIQELEHTKIYLEIERVRYEDALRIQYDIACTDFKLPTLTLQPIVENAVRHGARGKKGVGTVSIATHEYPDHYEITVADDGPGFDPEAMELADDGREHIGIANARQRLKQLSGGTLRIRSERGKGTMVTIEIPKKQEYAI